MSILEDYEQWFKLTPIDDDEVGIQHQLAEGKLRDEINSGRNFSDLPTYNRVIVWLHDRLSDERAAYAALKSELDRREDEVSKLCARNAGLEAELEELRGRKIGKADTWAEAASEATGMYDHMRKLHEAMKATIRSLLDTELPAGELRKALGELVR